MLDVVTGHFDGILRFPASHLGNVSGEEDCFTELDEFFTNESKLNLLDGLFRLSFLFFFHAVTNNNNERNHFQDITQALIGIVKLSMRIKRILLLTGKLLIL